MLIEFVLIWTLITLPLGPNAVSTVHASISDGWQRARFFTFGIAGAALVYASVTLLGVSAFLSNKPQLMAVLSVLGSFYLIYLAYKIYRQPPLTLTAYESHSSSTNLMARGFAISLSNPKAALVFFSVLPGYFVQAQSGIEMVSIFVIIFLTPIAVYMGYALLAAQFREYFLENEGRQIIFNAISALSFCIIAVSIWISAFHAWNSV